MNFAEVEREVAKLRRDLAAGRLTEEQFKARLRELMLQDEEGNWWMVGYETGGWYRHDGTDWVPDQPPGYAPSAARQPPTLPEELLPRRAPQPVAWLAAFRPNWRGLGLTLLGAVLYGGGNVITCLMNIPVAPFTFIPSLFGVLFGPWVGGFAGALGTLVSHVLGPDRAPLPLTIERLWCAHSMGGIGRDWAWSLGVALGAFALGMLPGLMVKDARNWKEVLGAGTVAGVIFGLDIVVTEGIVNGLWRYFAPVAGQQLITRLPPNILLLPLLAYWLVKPVRRWGLYWWDRR